MRCHGRGAKRVRVRHHADGARRRELEGDGRVRGDVRVVLQRGLRVLHCSVHDGMRQERKEWSTALELFVYTIMNIR